MGSKRYFPRDSPELFRQHSSVFSKAAQILFGILLVVTILDVTGGQWTVLQTIAWGRMIVDYSRQTSLKQAVQQTFDGQHPCKMCKGIEKARESEKKQEAPQVVLKREFFYERSVFFIVPPNHFWLQTIPDFVLSPESHRPPVPPPRCLLV